MNTSLAPQHVLQVSDRYILWFQTSNQYIIVSETIREIMEVYSHCHSELDFKDHLRIHLNIAFDQGQLYFQELSELLIAVNSEVKIKSQEIIWPPIPRLDLEEVYSFGTTAIKINFCSEQVRSLLHPQWSHAVSENNQHQTVAFNVFKEGDLLYLFRNNSYVGGYSNSEYHLLQGKFSLQMINPFYDKTESDWIATLHASTICNNQEAIMLIGDSGNGKSTLSALLMAHGIDVLADDFTPLSAENKEVYRFPSGISVKPGAFEMLKTIYKDFDTYPVFKSTSKNVNVKYIPPIKSMADGPLHLPCTKIIYVKFDKNTASNLQEIGIEKVLETLIPESWISPLAENSKLFLEWLKALQCFELNYSDNDFAVSNIRKLFDS